MEPSVSHKKKAGVKIDVTWFLICVLANFPKQSIRSCIFVHRIEENSHWIDVMFPPSPGCAVFPSVLIASGPLTFFKGRRLESTRCNHQRFSKRSNQILLGRLENPPVFEPFKVPLFEKEVFWGGHWSLMFIWKTLHLQFLFATCR